MTMLFSTRNIFLTLLLTIVSIVSMSAQTFSGRIISTKGGVAVPFANVMVKGTTNGIATDDSGEFSITVENEKEGNVIIISAVGFTSIEKLISDLNNKTVNIITLTPQEYDIEQVDVQAISKVLYGGIKKCAQMIATNYITEAYSCDFAYTNNEKNAQGVITDKTGYVRTTAKGTFRKINYVFNPSEKDTASLPYFGGKTNMEDLLSFDLIRNVGNIIDQENVYDYDLEVTKDTNDKIWGIHFSAREPDIHNTGDAHATKYEGELFINKEDFSVFKIIVRGSADKRSIHGKSIIVGEKSTHYISDLSYETTVNYTEKDGKLRLNDITMTENFTNKDGVKTMTKSSLTITKKKNQVVDIQGRDFYVEGL